LFNLATVTVVYCNFFQVMMCLSKKREVASQLRPKKSFGSFGRLCMGHKGWKESCGVIAGLLSPDYSRIQKIRE